MRTIQDLRTLQALPLDIKILKSKQRIREWVTYFGLTQVYISFSGGKDSTVLLHLARQLYPEIIGVFADTGLEFPEIRAFVRLHSNIEWVKPEMNFRQVIDQCGYPIISKEQAEWIHRVRHGNSEKELMKNIYGILPNGGTTKYRLSEQWRYLVNAPFEIGSGCCKIMKKKPIAKYGKLTGRTAPIIATMAAESMLRTQVWLKQGCNSFESKKQVSTPLSFWTDEDIWAYLKTYNVPYSEIYDLGYKRTGCIFCAFGAHLEQSPNRFQRLQMTHPKLWRYCLKDWDSGGLGMRHVLDYIGVAYENY